MVCKNCGSYNDDTAKFCIGCGSVLSEQQENSDPCGSDQGYNDCDNVNTPPVYNQTGNFNQYPPVAPNNANASVSGKGLAVAGMVCGIVSFFCFGIVLGILAIVFGGVAKSKGYKGGMATAGIVCGIVGLALYILLLVLSGSSAFIPFTDLANL